MRFQQGVLFTIFPGKIDPVIFMGITLVEKVKLQDENTIKCDQDFGKRQKKH